MVDRAKRDRGFVERSETISKRKKKKKNQKEKERNKTTISLRSINHKKNIIHNYIMK